MPYAPGRGLRPARQQLLPIAAALILIVAATLVLQIRWNPAVEPMRPDSGLFAYGGQALTSGADLYQDVWDNKPPGIFYLNSLAVSMSGPSPWSLWAASGLAVILAAAAVFLAVYLAASPAAASVSTIIFLLAVHHPSYYEGGNLTELYALVPNAAILLAFAIYLRRSYRAFPAVVGGLSALAFLLKPNLIAVGTATILLVSTRFALIGEGQRSVKAILSAGLGLALVLTPVTVYFAWQGTLDDLLNAVFTSTISYSGETLSIRSLYGTARKLLIEQPLGSLVGTAFLTTPLIVKGIRQTLDGIPDSQSRRGASGSPGWLWLASAAVLAFPLQTLSAAATGRNFGHYFLDPILSLSVNAGLLLTALRRIEGGRWKLPVASTALFFGSSIMLSTLPAVLPSFHSLALFPNALADAEFIKPAVHDYILQNTTPGDEVLVWSNHPSINFLSGRRPPTAYLHVYHVLDPGPAGVQRFERFLQDLELDLPRMIVAQPQSSAGIPYFAAGGQALCPDCEPGVRERMERLQELIGANYSPTAEIADWVVFELKE